MRYFPSYKIQAEWWRDELTPAEIGARAELMVARVNEILPRPPEWHLLDGYDSVPLAEAAKSMTAFVEHSLDWKGPDEEPDDPSYGWAVIALGWKPPGDVLTSDSITIDVNAGAKATNGFEFAVGGVTLPNDFSLVTYPIYRGALGVLASVWPCAWAVANVFELGASANLPNHSNRVGKLGWRLENAWIAYLSAPLATGLTPPREIIYEPTPGRGVILSAIETRLNLANPEHMRRSRMLEEILVERVGLDKRGRAGRHAARTTPY